MFKILFLTHCSTYDALFDFIHKLFVYNILKKTYNWQAKVISGVLLFDIVKHNFEFHGTIVHYLTENFFWNKQLMSMIIFNVFLAAESDSDIRFPPSRLDFAAHEVTIFRKQ